MLRVTKQNVETLSSSPVVKTVRVTKQVVEVLSRVSTNLALADSLSFTDSFSVQTPNVGAADGFGLSESFIVVRERAISVADSLTFSESFVAAETRDLAWSDAIAFAESCRPVKYRTFRWSDSLSLVESLPFPADVSANDGLAFAEEFAIVRNVAFAWSDSLTLDDAAALRSAAETLSRTYSPIGLPPLSVTPGDFELRGATTVIVPKPEFGNKESIRPVRIQRETRRGTLEVYAGASWPRPLTFTVQFEVTRAKSRELMQFFYDNFGAEITVLDWEGFLWSGVVTRIDDAKEDHGFYLVGFEFEGERC